MSLVSRAESHLLNPSLSLPETLRKLRHPSRSRKLKAFVEGVKEM
jgi:hypothetical protein